MQAVVESYHHYLEVAKAAVFSDMRLGGFWNPEKGAIIREKIMNTDFTWENKPEVDLRYMPFALMGVLLDRLSSEDVQYDNKIQKNLSYLKNAVNEAGFDTIINELHYGIFTSLAIGYKLFQDEACLGLCKKIFYYSRKTIKKISDNQLSLMLWGYAWLHELYEPMDDFKNELTKEMSSHCDYIVSTQNENGFFITGDLRALYHQRTMYTLWALARSAKITGEKRYLKNVERSLDYIVKKRFAPDGALLWHPPLSFITSKIGVPVPFYSPVSAHFLFECHQTFFVVACEEYYKAGGTKDYTDKEITALNWIFGSNRLNLNLVEKSGIGVPLRIINGRNNHLFVLNQNFKGTYEIGSYIYALSILGKRLKK